MAAYRYGCIRQEIADTEIKIKQTKDLVRAKNPYLLTFINKIWYQWQLLIRYIFVLHTDIWEFFGFSR